MTYADLKNEICNTWLQLNTEQMKQVRLALLDLSTSTAEIPRMRDINRCTDLASALRLLEKWKLLTPYKVDLLLWLTKQVGLHTEMVRERIQAYKKLNESNDLSQTVNNANHENSGSTRGNPIYQSICEYLSENLRDRWIDLGRSLGLSELVSDLQRTPARQKDKIYQVLEEHAKLKGKNALPLLLKALESCSLKRQHDYILKRIISS